VVSGAFQVVHGSANSTTLAAGASEYVFSGATASNTTVGSGALLYIVASGTANNNTINAGGLQYVYGSASGTTLSGSGTLGYVFNGGVADNLSIVGSGATEQVNVGGILAGGSVLSGALEYILGSGSNILVSGTGALMQMYGATTSITVGSGGIEVVNSGTVDSAATITLGGDQVVLATASAVSATVATSGRQDVLGSATATLVSGLNGRMVISSGGHASGDRIFSGGVETINNGGVTTGTFVSGIGGAFATELLNAGGVASNTSVGSGGRILVSGGTTSNAVISSGATETVFSGGTAVSTTVSGGAETVSSGGTLTGATLSGGKVEIMSSGTAGSSTITISSGTLLLDDSQSFNGTVAGLADANQKIDLADIIFNFASLQPMQYSDSGGSGTLTVTDGIHTAHLALIGTYTVASFKMAADSNSGTIITDPPVSGSTGVASPY
jgi:fibronectin-binding autotransporter adhesin